LMASYPSCEQGTYYAIARSARVLDVRSRDEVTRIDDEG
jgi:hypothetical protein